MSSPRIDESIHSSPRSTNGSDRADLTNGPSEVQTSALTANAPIPVATTASSHSRADRANGGRGRAIRSWWTIPVFLALLAGIAVVATRAKSPDRGVRGPADQGAPDAPQREKVPSSANP